MRLREHLGTLYGHVSAYDGRPTATQQRRSEELSGELSEARDRGNELLASLDRINELLEERGLQPVTVMDRDAWNADNGIGTSAGPAPLSRALLGEFVSILGRAF